MVKNNLLRLVFIFAVFGVGVAKAEAPILAHFDIEADWWDVMHSSMISLGISFTDTKGNEIASFLGDMKPFYNHQSDADTMAWRNNKNAKELARIKANAKDPYEVMGDLARLLDELTIVKKPDGSVVEDKNGAPVRKPLMWIAKPASFDYSWLYGYYNMWVRNLVHLHAPLRLHFAATCLSTMRDVYQHQHGLSRAQMEAKVKEWTPGTAVTHNPLDDARHQAQLYFRLVKELGISLDNL